MFGITTDEKMPESFITDHQAWDDYVSQVWGTVISSYGLNNKGVIVEFGPGASTKVGGALALHDFAGTLYVVDALQSVIDVLKPKYKEILPKATIHYVAAPLAKAYSGLPKDIDLLLGSHVLDDMIVGGVCFKVDRKSDALDWSSKYTFKPTENLKTVWRELQQDDILLENCKNDVIDDLQNAIAHLNPSLVMLNQYPSSTLYDSDMQSLNDHSYEVFKDLKALYQKRLCSSDQLQGCLNKHKNYSNDHIGNHVLNAQYWMVVE